MKFTEECVMCIENHVLVKKCSQMSKIGVCQFKPESKRQSVELKHTVSSVKKKFQALASNEGHDDNLLEMKGPITADFLEKGTNVNIAFNC